MKIFVLDDSPLRLDIFHRRFDDEHNVWTAQTAKQAIAVLEQQEFDLIFLDHHLGGKPPEYYGQDCDINHANTGSEVVRWMLNHPNRFNVIVHSRNEIAAPDMVAKISSIDGAKCLAIPFDKLSMTWNLGSAI